MIREMPVRVAVDATSLFGARTGVGVFTAEVLARLGDHPEVEARAFAVTWRGRGALPALLPAGVRPADRLPAPARPLRQAWRRVDWPPIEWWTGTVDVVHGPNFVVPPTRHAARLVTVHDLTPVRLPELGNRDTAAYPGLLRRALRGGAHVHVPSSFVAGEVVDLLGADPGRVHVIALGVSAVTGGDPARGLARAGGPYVLALGTVEPRKDLPRLVAAFDAIAADHDDLRLVVAGPDGWGVVPFAAAVDAAAHRNRIVRAGFVDDAARADLLAGAAVFAYPSRYEGFGLPPLEAMAAGTPVVATDAGALPEVCGDAALLVPTGDTDALAAGLDRVVADDALRETLVGRGRARAAAFSWDECTAGLRRLYARLTASR
jgi:glycosyltransferase involved in cell wall biosynthesis